MMYCCKVLVSTCVHDPRCFVLVTPSIRCCAQLCRMLFLSISATENGWMAQSEACLVNRLTVVQCGL